MNEDPDELQPEVEEQPEPETQEPEPQAPSLDLDALAVKVAEQLRPPPQQTPTGNPIGAIAEKFWENPEQALTEYGQIIQKQTMEAMAPYINPVAQNFAMSQAKQGLEAEGAAFVDQFVRDNNINPNLLNDPTVADLIRSKAELHQIKKSGAMNRREVPETYMVGGQPMPGVDGQTKQALTGLEQLYNTLGVKFDAMKLMNKVKN